MAATDLKQATEELRHREDVLKERLSYPDFLANRGLGNEVGIFIACYDPALEPQAQAMFSRLVHDSEMGVLPCAVRHFDLYDVLIQICEEKRVLDAIPRMEERRGTDALINQLEKTASPEAFAEAIARQPHKAGDAILITGVGEVYPILRVHTLLDNIQHLFSDVPVIVAYPGKYDGQSLRLFAGARSKGLDDGNYYRAFDLV